MRTLRATCTDTLNEDLLHSCASDGKEPHPTDSWTANERTRTKADWVY